LSQPKEFIIHVFINSGTPVFLPPLDNSTATFSWQ